MKKTVTVLGIVMLIAAFAYPVFGRGPGWGAGWGGGHHMMGNWGRGYMMGDWGNGPGYSGTYNRGYGNLTEDQAKQMDALNRNFSDKTADLREKLWTKSGELNALMNSADPDPARVRSLQKEISDLRANMDEARTEYELEARKITPDTSYGRGYGYGGPMMGYGMGRGGYGPGACWN